ncbi:endonuclease domain-containing protein [Amycolatopsis sp. NPDC089917]|uniref:endonuclease domain-containing protein n=1 Tax=Amycolatopsis sp. NPDC089917 TaxID=3155187 RepID=UPI0034363878
MHLSTADKAIVELWAGNEPPTSAPEDEPACWSWPAIGGEGNGRGEHDETSAVGQCLLQRWQDGRCAICGEREKLYQDHDHDSGLVRGLLCQSCNTGENGSPIWEKYRERPPCRILRLEFRYFDPNLADYAPDLAEFRASLTDLVFGACFRCCAAKGDRCGCPPFYRLDPIKLAGSLGNFVLAAATMRVNGIRHLLQSSVTDLQGLEGQFVRDLILLPRLDYIAGKWFGGKEAASMASRSVDLVERSYEDEPVGFATAEVGVPVFLCGRLVAAMAEAGKIAMLNSDPITQGNCLQISSSLGLALSSVGSGSVAEVEAGLLVLLSSLLLWVADRVLHFAWECENPEYSTGLAEAFRSDAELVRELLARVG